jgi:hypothetical protein
MIALLRRMWPHIVNVGSMTWAAGHCYITAFGTQEQRYVAASSGLIGAIIILIVLNLSVREAARDELRDEAAQDGIIAAAAFIRGLRSHSDTQSQPATPRD